MRAARLHCCSPVLACRHGAIGGTSRRFGGLIGVLMFLTLVDLGAADWSLDAPEAQVVDAPLSGKLFGQTIDEFTVRVIEGEVAFLFESPVVPIASPDSMQESGDAEASPAPPEPRLPDTRIEVSIGIETALLNAPVVVTSALPDRGQRIPQVRMRLRQQGKSPLLYLFTAGYALHLQIERDGDKVSGSVYLAMPDHQHSVIAGSFETTWGFGLE